MSGDDDLDFTRPLGPPRKGEHHSILVIEDDMIQGVRLLANLTP